MPRLVPNLSSLRASDAAPVKRPASGAQAAPARPHHHWLAGGVAVLGLALLAALLIFAFGGGASEPPPATGAAALVPSDALLYVHLSTDPTRPAVKRMDRLMARLPDHGAAIDAYAQRTIAVLGGSTATNWNRDIRPWLGKEAAFAFLNSSGASAGSIIVMGVRSRPLATAFITRQGAQPVGTYAGTRLLAYPTGAELAFVHGYLVVGVDAGVRAAINAADRKLAALPSNAAYQQATSDEPDSRVLDVYASSAGVSRIFDARSGLLGAIGALFAQPALIGTAVSVSADSPGLTVHVHTALDPKVAASDHKRLQSFSPSLVDLLPSGSTLMLDAQNLSSVAPTVLNAISQIGLLHGIPDLLSRLGSALQAQGYNVHSVLNLFNGETAVALAHGSGAPALVIVTKTSNEAAARSALANLEAPLTELFSAPSSGGGIAPEVADMTVGGVSAHQIQLAPGLQLDYAVFHGLVVVSSSLRGIGDIARRSGQLSDDKGYQAVLGNHPGSVTSLGFANFSQLLSLGEQTSLARGASYDALQPDLQRIRAAGMSSTGGEADTTAELSFQIS